MMYTGEITSSCASLLLRRECCSFSNGEYVKAGLAELELWCAKAKPEVKIKPTICGLYLFALNLNFCCCCSMLDHHGMNLNTLGKLLVSWYVVSVPIWCIIWENDISKIISLYCTFDYRLWIYYNILFCQFHVQELF